MFCLEDDSLHDWSFQQQSQFSPTANDDTRAADFRQNIGCLETN